MSRTFRDILTGIEKQLERIADGISVNNDIVAESRKQTGKYITMAIENLESLTSIDDDDDDKEVLN